MIPRNIARLIVSKINQYARDPAALANNVKALKGEHVGLIRLRVGDWRVIMDDRGHVLAEVPMNEMPKSQIIVSPSGERMVVLPESDYAALVERLEDAEDLVSAKAVLERIANGEKELVPSHVVERLVEGDNPIKVWREHRGMTVSGLAEKAGLSQSYLSQIESGKREGRVGVLQRLAVALSVDLEDLVTGDGA